MSTLAALAFITLACSVCFTHASFANISFIYAVTTQNNLYIGNSFAAANFTLLQQYNISALLNVAWDLDLEYPPRDFNNPKPYYPDNTELILQYHKAGLVDGTGNTNFSMAAALYLLKQLFTPRALEPKDQTTFPNPVRNVLLHCHSGLSRSITVGSLYLFYTTNKFATFNESLSFVQEQRGDPTVFPAAPLLALANQMSSVNVLDFF